MKLPNKKLNDNKSINLYAYISSISDFDIKEQDYEPYNLSITLTVINKETFENQDYNNEGGCDTIILSIGDYPYLCHEVINFIGFPHENNWFEIKGNICKKSESNSYFYQAFSELDSDQTYININEINLIKNEIPSPTPKITSLSDLESLIKNEEKEGNKAEFHSFHVGQGMCSLMTIGSTGIIFDMGAGKPVQRQTYGRKRNDLSDDYINKLESIYILISHLDDDHWRLMEWEIARSHNILSKIKKIIIPDSGVDLSFKNSKIINKVGSLGVDYIINSTAFILNIYRSQPEYINNSNSNCLVCDIELNKDTILIPGDYVYRKMLKDKNTKIQAIPNNNYSLIIVPHHGDDESSKNVPNSVAKPLASRAYFSAGTHAGYSHPRQSSRDAHKNNHFQEIVDNQCDIIKVAVSIK